MKFYALALLLGAAVAQKPKADGCPGKKFVLVDTCVRECPAGHAATYQNGFAECQKCDLTKYLIPNFDQTACVCANHFYLNPNTGNCESCHESCGSCNGPSPSQCLTCNPLANRVVVSGSQCLCAPGFFENGSIVCPKCETGCQICSGPDGTRCLSCVVGRIPDSFGHCICQGNFIPDANGQCVCPSPYTITNGQCTEFQSQCGPNEVEVFSGQTTSNNGNAGGRGNGNGNLQNNGKKTSPTNSTPSCQCRPGLVRIKGVCSTCGPNEEYNPNSQRCSCVKEAFKYQGQCIVCPAGQTFKNKTGKCECKKNEFKTEQGGCIRCPNKEIYSQGQCICAFNYYRDPRNNKCRKCTNKSDNANCVEVQNNFEEEDRLESVSI